MRNVETHGRASLQNQLESQNYTDLQKGKKYKGRFLGCQKAGNFDLLF